MSTPDAQAEAATGDRPVVVCLYQRVPTVPPAWALGAGTPAGMAAQGRGLRLAAGLTTAQIAAVLQQTVDAVKQIQYRALRRRVLDESW